MVACFPKLEVRRRRGQLVNEKIDSVGEPSMLVSLEVRFQVFFRKAFVNLEDTLLLFT